MTFFDVYGRKTPNDFRIAQYEWAILPDGDVIERRFDGNGDLIRNRPGFGFIVTRLARLAQGVWAGITRPGSGT